MNYKKIICYFSDHNYIETSRESFMCSPSYNGIDEPPPNPQPGFVFIEYKEFLYYPTSFIITKYECSRCKSKHSKTETTNWIYKQVSNWHKMRADHGVVLPSNMIF